jgi:hypothetical protein
MTSRFGLGGCEAPTRTAELEAIFSLVANVKTMPVHRVFGGRPGKDYPAKDLPNKEAVDHLFGPRLDDQGCISRLRLSGPDRLYRFRHGRYFHMLWWDPRHDVWPRSVGL